MSEACDTDGNGWLSDLEIRNVQGMILDNHNIASLQGIEYLTEILHLDCRGLKLTSLDLTANVILHTLYCDDNQLRELRFAPDSCLDYIHCSGNQLTNLDVSGLELLEILNCENNQLTELQLNLNTNLTSLFCGGNQINELDVSANENLLDLNCTGSGIVSLDLRNNHKLGSLIINECRALKTLFAPPQPLYMGQTTDGFQEMSLKAYYPASGSWNEDDLFDNGGFITWIPYNSLFTLSFDAAGGIGAPAELLLSDLETFVLTEEPTREGYTFQGWDSQRKATDVEYKTGDSFSGNSDVTLYAVWKQNLLPAPVISSLSNTVEGIKIAWTAVEGAGSYRLYRSAAGGGWTKLEDVEGLSYIDTAVDSATKYSYKLRALSPAPKTYLTAYSEGKSINYYEAPVVTAVSNTVDGVKVDWQQVMGITWYRVYRSVNGSAWELLTETTDLSVVDGGVDSGVKYTYTVRCLNNARTKTLSAYTNGKTIGFYAAPVISSISNTVDGVKISWGQIKGVTWYQVFRKTGSGSWEKLDVTKELSFTDTKVSSATKYIYTVRCLNNKQTQYCSANNSGKTINYYAAPIISSLTNTASGVKIAWGQVQGIRCYRVYRKTAGGSWEQLTDLNGLSFVDNTAKSGVKYTYTVRCLNNAMTKTLSAYTSGKSITFKK